jgi:hypothetical protein
VTSTVLFLFLSVLLVRAFLDSAREAFYFLPVFLVVAARPLICIALGVWRAFGVEEIVISNGILLWTRKALWWTSNFESKVGDITNVVAETPWHCLTNRVEFVSKGRTYSIGDMILTDEAKQIAHELKRAIAPH